MDKENVVYMYNGILFNYAEEENSAICKMCGPRGHYAKRNKPDRSCYPLLWTHKKKKKKDKHVR